VLSLLVLTAGLALIVGGAELFFSGLVATAARLRVAPFVLTVVLSGFELENLAAGIAANAQGFPDAAAGTFLGGTTFLALAVAGLAAVARPIEADLPAAILLWTAAAPLPLLALGLDGELSRTDGAILVVWFGVALTALAYSGRSLPAERPRRSRLPLVRMLGGLALLSAGGEVLGEGIRRAVTGLGVSEALLGNTAIAAAVEAEEVGRVTVPARRGRGDVALGNVLGTIVHFAAFNAGVIALVRPLELADVSRALFLPVAAGSVLTLTAAIAAHRGLTRADGVALLGLYAAYVATAIAVSI